LRNRARSSDGKTPIQRTKRLVCWLSIALGLIAALLHWPIDERAIARLRTQS